MGEQLIAARKRKAELTAQPMPQATDSEPPLVTETRRLLHLANLKSVSYEIEACERDNQTFDIRGRLLTAQMDLAAPQAAHAEKVVRLWRNHVNEARQREAAQAAIEAARQEREAAFEATGASPGLREAVESIAADTAAAEDVPFSGEKSVSSVPRT